MKFHIQWISFPASMVAKYSASVYDSVIIPHSFEDQDTSPVPSLTRYPPVDLPLSLHPLWFASEKVVIGLLDIGLG